MSWSKWNGNKVIRKASDAVAQGLLDGAEVIGDMSQEQVPHDEGALSETLRIIADPSNPHNVWIGYGYGEGFIEVPYARKWHETPANFQKGRKHNYLGDPVKTAKSQNIVPKAIAIRMKQAL